MSARIAQPVVVIGAGPAGLMAAEVICRAGLAVEVYDAKPSAGRKFLVAGKGGLNLTHSEPLEAFLARYGERSARLEPWLRDFGPQELRQWAAGLGFETFVGTSGRVFPVGMKAAPLLRAWLSRLAQSGVNFHYRRRWLGWNDSGQLRFETPAGEMTVPAAATVLALGGGSWPKLGSDGAWVPWLSERGVEIAPLRPVNCGFNLAWSDHFRERYAGQPVKNVTLSFDPPRGASFHRQGEFVITATGIEGSLVYAVSAALRDAIETCGPVQIMLDLAPGWSETELSARLERHLSGGRSLASVLEKAARLKGVGAGLLREAAPAAELRDAQRLAGWIKRLPLTVLSPRPLEEAISSAGGVRFETLDARLMLAALPGVFCAGEMLDWEAPTGGYLLTACFATGRAAGLGVVNWLSNTHSKRSIPLEKLSKRERVDAALRGDAVDRAPVSAWTHLIPAETNTETLAAASLQFFREYDWDWMKVNPRATYYAEAWGNRYDYQAYDRVYPKRVDGPVQSLDDLERIQAVSPTAGPFAEQLDLMRQIKAGIGNGAGPAPHFLQTVFSPLSVLGFLLAKPERHSADAVVQTHAQGVGQAIREYPQATHTALSAITQTLVGYVSALVDAGASGIFFAIVKLARQAVLTPAEYAEFGRRYDLQVLEAVQGAPFNLLHICGPAVHFDMVSGYPVHAINWAAVGQQNPSVSEAFQRTPLAVVGGVDEDGALLSGAPGEVLAEARAALQAGRGRKFLLAPGCAVSPNTPPANLRALRQAVE